MTVQEVELDYCNRKLRNCIDTFAAAGRLTAEQAAEITGKEA